MYDGKEAALAQSSPFQAGGESMRGRSTHGRKLFAWLLFCCCLSLNVRAADKPSSYDGLWWLTIDNRQRMLFIDGFRACYFHLVDRHTHLYDEDPRLAYVPRLNAYLHDHPEATTESVESLLWKISGPPYARTVHHPAKGNESGDEVQQKWGPYDDGEEWRGLSDTDRLGTIQGFLECYDKHTNHEHGTFSRPREWYVKKISGWYGVKPDDEGVVDPKTVNDKIPEVLFRLHDEATH